MMKFTRAKIFLFCFLFLLVPFLKAEAQPSASDYSCMVLIDPGHGGDDTGVKVSRKEVEKNITLAIALALKKELESNGITVCLTRGEDVSLSIEERIAMVEQLKPRVLLSLHVNGGFGRSASGYEISFPAKQNTAGQDKGKIQHVNHSIRLAQVMQNNLEEVFPRKGRGVREAPVPLLSVLHAPSVCIELAFLTNEADRKVISGKKQKAVVQALTRGVQEYLK